MPFGGIPQLSIGHKLSGHSQLDYDIISFPKSKEEFSLFYLKNWNFSDKSHPKCPADCKKRKNIVYCYQTSGKKHQEVYSMATNCGWCGTKIGFTDFSYTVESVGNRDICICGECSNRIYRAKAGKILFDEITTEATDPDLFNHISRQVKPATDDLIQRRIRELEQQGVKEEAQAVDPLYEDIHQIAQDLRFIKNYLIFCIVLGAVAGFFWFLSLL